MPRLLVFLLLLPAILSAAEIPLTAPRIGPAADVQFESLAASDGDSYFVLWTDGRARVRETWGTRVSRDGSILDPTGIRLFDAEMRLPQLLWTGNSYLVVWQSGSDLWMLRVGRDGKVIDPPRAIVAEATPAGIARSDTQVAIGYSRGSELHALVVTPEGRPIVDLRLPAADEPHDGPQLAWNGLYFVAIWAVYGETPRIEGVRFSQGGPLDREPRVLVVDGTYVRPRVASDGTNLVMLSATAGNLSRHVVRRVSDDLSTAGPAVALPETIDSEASIVWAGEHYIVAAASGSVTYGVRVDREARLLDAAAIAIDAAPASGSSASPSLAANGRDILVAWTGRVDESAEGWPDVFASLASPSTLAARTRALLSRSATREMRPVITSGVTSLLAMWSEASGLWAKRLALSGVSIDAVPIRVTDGEGVAQATFNGTDYVVAWTDSREIRTFRIPRDGALQVTGGSRINAREGRSLALASDWTTTVLAMSGNAVRVVRLGPDATMIGAPQQITNAPALAVDIASNGLGEFLLAWGDLAYPPPFFQTAQPADVIATRLTPSLINLHPGGIPIANTSAMEGDPSITWNGSQWLVAWNEARSLVRARHVAANGTFSGPDYFIASGALLPEVAWDGRHSVFVWLATDGRWATAFRAAWFSHLGAPPIHARELGEAERWPPAPISVIGIAPGVVAFGYARLAREPQYGGVTRAFALFAQPAALRRRAVR